MFFVSNLLPTISAYNSQRKQFEEWVGKYLKIPNCSKLCDSIQEYIDQSDRINNLMMAYSNGVWAYEQNRLDIASRNSELDALQSRASSIGDPITPFYTNIVANAFGTIHGRLLAQLWEYYLAGRYETLDPNFVFGKVSACSESSSILAGVG